MSTTNSQTEVLRKRLEEKLSRECGHEMVTALNNPKVIEVMLNQDGKVWLDVLGEGMKYSGFDMSASSAESMLATCASMLNTTITYENPILEGEFPLDGSRLEGLIHPIVRRPVFAIRKKAINIFTLDDYVKAGIITPAMTGYAIGHGDSHAGFENMSHPVDVIRQGVRNRNNILVVGGTGSGKTTLVNAVLAEIAKLCPDDRLVAIEDTVELQISLANSVLLRANEHTNMQRLLRATMRLRPDRIVVGEVRGGEALTLLKSWNTGHPGGCATVHANSAEAGLTRVRQLIYEAPEARNLSDDAIGAMIAEAINLILFIERIGESPGRRVSEMMLVQGYKGGSFILKPVIRH
ncbi:MAG TPA: P-type conjugative transfer ATPase TrbB [Burkholderiales bacterium]|nr:P-type conjugative transfer ATPase TrbB [Burkholderiales bacterium]